MAFSIGNGRYCKLFPGNAPPRRVLIEDLREPGLLSSAFIQGTVVKVYPIKCSERFGKLCKLLLKEDAEKSTRNSQLAVINTFLLGDLANEGSRICEGDRVVLAEVIVECSPTDEHQFQLILWRGKSQASIWVINNKGKVRANTAGGMTTTSIDGVEEAEITTNNKQTVDNFNFSSDSDEDLYALCENDFLKSLSKDGKDTSEQTKQKFFEKRKGKVYLRPKGAMPSTSHVKRSFSNLAVLLDKGEVEMVMRTANVRSKGKSRKKSFDSCKNSSTETLTGTTHEPSASVPNEVEEAELTTNNKQTADNYDFSSDSDKDNNNKGKVRANTAGGMTTTSIDEVEEAEITTNNNPISDNYDFSSDSDEDLFASCENNFSKSTSKDGNETSKQTRQKVFEKRKGKFHLGPKGVTPSTSHVERSFSNLAVLVDKGEAKMVMKTVNVHSKGISRKESCDSFKNNSTETCTGTTPVPNAGSRNADTPHSETPSAVRSNGGTCTPNARSPILRRPNADTTASVGNVNTSHASPASRHVPSSGQSVTMSQETGPGSGTGSLSVSIQSTSPDKRSNTQFTHMDLIPTRKSTRIRNGDPSEAQVRDKFQVSTVSNNLPWLGATQAGCSSPKICEENNSLKIGDLQDKPSEDSAMPDFEHEEHVFMSARRMSASSEIHHGSPAKGITERNSGTPQHLKIIDKDLEPASGVRTMIPDDYTPATSLLANQDSTDRGVKRSPAHLSLDPKRLRTSAVPSHQAPLPDRDGNTVSDRSRNRSSRVGADYTVPPGYTTLANLQADTTVNVYGVVKLFKPAWKCRGTDMCSVLMLMDPTLAESSLGLECVLFQPSVSRLPAAHRIGDIVRLHRIKISQYQGRLQAKSTRGFAAIVFDRETELPVTAEMARVTSSTFTLTQSDKETVESLKNWCDIQPVLFPPGNSVALSRIHPDSYFDLTCQVLGIALHRTLDCVVLYVTDGTQPVHDLRKCTGEEYNMVEPPCNRSSHDDDVTSVFLYGSHSEVARLLVSKGGYVILHNVHSQMIKPGGSACSVLDVAKPCLELCVHRGTVFGRGISVLSADSPEVNQLKRQQNL